MIRLRMCHVPEHVACPPRGSRCSRRGVIFHRRPAWSLSAAVMQACARSCNDSFENSSRVVKTDCLTMASTEKAESDDDLYYQAYAAGVLFVIVSLTFNGCLFYTCYPGMSNFDTVHAGWSPTGERDPKCRPQALSQYRV
jgi:hypothetical protein